MGAVTLNSAALAHLLETVSTAASKDGTLPILTGVQLYTAENPKGGTVLVGAATDRFVLMQGHVEIQAGALPGPLWLTNTQIRQVLTVTRPYRSRTRAEHAQAEIAVDGDICTVRQLALEGLGAIEVRFTVDTPHVPDMVKMIRLSRERATAAEQFAVDGVKLARLARLRAARQDCDGCGMRFRPTGPNTPVEISLGSQFMALLMPVRVDGEHALPVPLYDVPVLETKVAA